MLLNPVVFKPFKDKDGKDNFNAMTLMHLITMIDIVPADEDESEGLDDGVMVGIIHIMGGASTEVPESEARQIMAGWIEYLKSLAEPPAVVGALVSPSPNFTKHH